MERIIEKISVLFFTVLLAIPIWIFPNLGGLRDFYDMMTFSSFQAADKFVEAVNARDVDAVTALLCASIKNKDKNLPQKIAALCDAAGQKVDAENWDSPYGTI